MRHYKQAAGQPGLHPVKELDGWCWKDRTAALRKGSFAFGSGGTQELDSDSEAQLLAPKRPGCLNMPQICGLLAGQRPDAVPEHFHR